MPTFVIDTQNTIDAIEGHGPKNATGFRSEQELRKATADWPAARLVEVWNKLPGVTPVKKFQDRKTACGRIWKAIGPPEASVGAQALHVAPEGPGTRKKARKGEKRPTGREGGKKAEILTLLERSQGASLRELVAATGWQAHSVRGFISGSLKKKMGLTVESYKGESGKRAYRIKAN